MLAVNVGSCIAGYIVSSMSRGTASQTVYMLSAYTGNTVSTVQCAVSSVQSITLLKQNVLRGCRLA